MTDWKDTKLAFVSRTSTDACERSRMCIAWVGMGGARHMRIHGPWSICRDAPCPHIILLSAQGLVDKGEPEDETQTETRAAARGEAGETESEGVRDRPLARLCVRV
jgi:hypothetical protein